MTAVIANELLRQLHMKISDGLVLQTGSVVLVQHKRIGNSDIKQKVKDILVELPTFRTLAIIASKLVVLIHPSHELVGDDDFWTWHWHWNPGSILLPPKDCTSCCRLCVGRQHSDYFPVLPGRSCHTSLLNCE